MTGEAGGRWRPTSAASPAFTGAPGIPAAAIASGVDLTSAFGHAGLPIDGLQNNPISRTIAATMKSGMEVSGRNNLFLALTLTALVSSHAAASAEELNGTLAKVKELGYITIGHREAS